MDDEGFGLNRCFLNPKHACWGDHYFTLYSSNYLSGWQGFWGPTPLEPPPAESLFVYAQATYIHSGMLFFMRYEPLYIGIGYGARGWPHDPWSMLKGPNAVLVHDGELDETEARRIRDELIQLLQPPLQNTPGYR